jgi:hypothetical protein
LKTRESRLKIINNQGQQQGFQDRMSTTSAFTTTPDNNEGSMEDFNLPNIVPDDDEAASNVMGDAVAAAAAAEASAGDAAVTTMSSVVNGLTRQIPLEGGGKGIKWAPELVTYMGSSSTSDFDTCEAIPEGSDGSFDMTASGDIGGGGAGGVGAMDYFNSGMHEMNFRQVTSVQQASRG